VMCSLSPISLFQTFTVVSFFWHFLLAVSTAVDGVFLLLFHFHREVRISSLVSRGDLSFGLDTRGVRASSIYSLRCGRVPPLSVLPSPDT